MKKNGNTETRIQNSECRIQKPELAIKLHTWLLFFTLILNSGFWILDPSCAVAFDLSLHGFLQGNYSLNTASQNPDNGDFKWAEERMQLKLNASSEPFQVFIKADGFFDHIDKHEALELREGYLDYTAGKWDLRAGRQVMTWGLGDLIFINDVFPKDYEAFFSGRPLEYLKKGVDGVKLGAYPDFASFEFVVIPFFTPDNFPSQKRFWMFDPMSGVIDREERKPSNAEFAMRIYRDVAGFDLSAYFYKGFFRQPSIIADNPVMPTKLSLTYPRLSVYGASAQGRVLDGVLSLEAGYYDSGQDSKGTDPMIPNSQTRFLLGYQRQLWEDFTAGLQYYAEYMHNYSEYEKNLPAGFPKGNKLHELASLRITQFLIHQTLRLSLFAFYSPSERDYLFNPEIKYNFTDNIWTAIGGNFFGGTDKQSQFGQLDKNDNIYLQVRYEF